MKEFDGIVCEKKIEKIEINLDSCNFYIIVFKVLGCFISKSI